jgi:hypothetical protein
MENVVSVAHLPVVHSGSVCTAEIPNGDGSLFRSKLGMTTRYSRVGENRVGIARLA